MKWTKRLGGGASISLSRVRVDYIGYVDLAFIALSTQGSHVQIGSYSWLAAPLYNTWLARFGPNTGSTQWAVRYGDAQTKVISLGMGTTSNGRLLLAGDYTGTPDFGDGPMPAPASGPSGFIARIHQ